MTNKLRDIAQETAAKLIPHTTSVHNVDVIYEALRSLVPEGNVVVPVEPTKQQLLTLALLVASRCTDKQTLIDGYKAITTAAQKGK